jgi:predicted RNA binding protein YcfA (HicA-like mRNA interferase family)
VTRVFKLYMRVASAPANARFEDVVSLAEAVGFVLRRQRGSHLVFRHRDNPRLRLNLQATKGKAKEYQVKDLLAKIEREHLWRW